MLHLSLIHIYWEAMAKKDLSNIDREKTAVLGQVPVSYTHLDVYKRQPI